MAHPKHSAVRERYAARCGYCTVSEGESGGDLTVDHFQPVSAGGDDAGDNLVYCCFRCNGYKADFYPDATDRRKGFRILHPLREDIAAHLNEIRTTGRIEALSETGRFHVDLLHLNRPQLVELRLSRRLHALLAESCQLLRDENEHLKNQITMLEQCVRELRRLQ
jgi:xanthine dehydrogenase iron-sulfur cluster and FAD-binding subunit A